MIYLFGINIFADYLIECCNKHSCGPYQNYIVSDVIGVVFLIDDAVFELKDELMKIVCKNH